MNKKYFVYFLILMFSFCILGCRGWRTEKPPIHLNPNMDFQSKNNAQSESLKRPDNVVPWGDRESFHNNAKRGDFAKDNTVFYFGKNSNGTFVNTIPVQVNYELINRGEERYNIYCAPCHGLDGSGKGSVTQKSGWFMPKPYWADSIVSYNDGELFDIITNGVRTMPSYKQQIHELDRWAVVAYLRVLQKTHLGRIDMVPEDKKNKLRRK
ncbi:quinol:cytochrome C oxidoreductase [Candidatus Marinamargulisbacteria bacterium SCGC AG-414-C22]|nr:quinol:cytochrome C oxidoreductase [Candidatus Marinamargulisbacteria bacterium SCGC AG-414-C22]